jgi:rapamycin-insensitive companion of mTOR
VQDPLLRGQRQVQQVKMRMGMQIDDKHFAMLINDTQVRSKSNVTNVKVVQGRDHTKWNYDILLEVIEGPLLNPKRLEEVIKVSKFLRRLFSFFHPYNQRFSNIQRTRVSIQEKGSLTFKPNQKWVKLACTLLTTMLANPDGIRYLLEDKLLRQVVECFSELDQVSYFERQGSLTTVRWSVQRSTSVR